MSEPNPNLETEKTVDIQAEIEKARKQEREKLHADIDRLKNELADKAKTCNDNYVTISDLQKQLGNKDKEMQDFETKIAKAKEDGLMEANKELEALKQELENYKAKLVSAEKEFADYKVAEELKAYKATKVKDIDEEFRSLVNGNTKEEVDASFEQIKTLQDTVKAKYDKKDNTLPTPKQKGKAPVKATDLINKLNSMNLDEYKELRNKNFK